MNISSKKTFFICVAVMTTGSFMTTIPWDLLNLPKENDLFLIPKMNSEPSFKSIFGKILTSYNKPQQVIKQNTFFSQRVPSKGILNNNNTQQETTSPCSKIPSQISYGKSAALWGSLFTLTFLILKFGFQQGLLGFFTISGIAFTLMGSWILAFYCGILAWGVVKIRKYIPNWDKKVSKLFFWISRNGRYKIILGILLLVMSLLDNFELSKFLLGILGIGLLWSWIKINFLKKQQHAFKY
jgi:hypothetical protein